MRKVSRALLMGVLLAVLAMLCSCTGMVQDELDRTRAKLEELKALADTVNLNLERLGVIVDHLDDSHTIEPASLQETEGGYKVSFRDGREIFIAYGKDGIDGRTLIPIGVKLDEDGLYYWTVDGKWLKDADGNMIRAGATDGVDGIAPQVKVEDGFWWISFDGGKTFEKLASCEEMNGPGVFSGIDLSDPTFIVLNMVDGTTLEIPRIASFRISFEGPVRDTLLISAGEVLPIPYKVVTEGTTDLPVVVTSGTDGIYFSEILESEQPGQGIVRVQAPSVFSEGYIILNAYCGGTATLKIIAFKERKTEPSAELMKVRIGSAADTLTVAYSANFAYKVNADTTWLKVVPDPESGSIVFEVAANESDTLRTCTVTISPEDNPDFVCTTFEVIQVSKQDKTVTYDIDSEGDFELDASNPASLKLSAPSDGGEATIWINSSDVEIRKTPEWMETEKIDDNEFQGVKINVGANDSDAERTDKIELLVRKFFTVDIIVTQAAKTGE